LREKKEGKQNGKYCGNSFVSIIKTTVMANTAVFK
jgi:hypothetical protein